METSTLSEAQRLQIQFQKLLILKKLLGYLGVELERPRFVIWTPIAKSITASFVGYGEN
jgi:hypothetical protein